MMEQLCSLSFFERIYVYSSSGTLAPEFLSTRGRAGWIHITVLSDDIPEDLQWAQGVLKEGFQLVTLTSEASNVRNVLVSLHMLI
jgi:hypothetical protein